MFLFVFALSFLSRCFSLNFCRIMFSSDEVWCFSFFCCYSFLLWFLSVCCNCFLSLFWCHVFSSVRLFFFFVGATKFPRLIIGINTIVIIINMYCYFESIIFSGATVFLPFWRHKVSQAFSRLHNSAAAMPMIARASVQKYV